MDKPLSVVVLISGSGSNLQALIDDSRKHQLYKISAVISNKEAAKGLERARQAEIPSRYLDHKGFADRHGFDQQLIRIIDRFQPDLVLLAGFMRILTAGFVQHYQRRMLNIHPSLLPRHKGLNTHLQALKSGDSEHGASVHFVTANLDSGPVIAQGKLSIQSEDSADSLAQKVLQLEHQIYPLVVRWFAENRLDFIDGQVQLDSLPLSQPVVFDFS